MANPFVGEIRLFAGNFAPQGWAFCNGATIAISQNPTLFTLIGTTYGGDGVNTFRLPDLQSRVPIHEGQGPGLSPYVIGQSAGSENVTLLVAELPQHSHAAQGGSAGNQASPKGNVWSADGGANVAAYVTSLTNNQPGIMNPAAIGQTGGDLPHSNLQPLLAITYIIALFGIFPSQN